MGVKVLDIVNPKAAAKAAEMGPLKGLMGKESAKESEGFHQLLDMMVQGQEDVQKIIGVKGLGKNPAAPQKMEGKNRQEKQEKQEVADLLQNLTDKPTKKRKSILFDEIPKDRKDIVQIGPDRGVTVRNNVEKVPNKETNKIFEFPKMEDILQPKQNIETKNSQKEVTALKEEGIDRKPFFFTNKKLENFESKMAMAEPKKPQQRNSFFPDKKTPTAIQKLDSSFEREALIDKSNVLPFRKAPVKQTYFNEIPKHMSDKETFIKEEVKVEPYQKFQQRDDIFFKPTEVVSTQVETPTKVLDLSQVQGTKPEVLEQISNYIMRNSFGNQKSLTVTVSHKDLGQFQIQAQRHGDPGDIKLNILTQTDEGQVFFKGVEKELIQKLNEKGINVFDLKVSHFSPSTPNTSKSDSSFSFQQNHSNNAYSDDSQKSQYNEGQERRRELWERYKEQLGA